MATDFKDKRLNVAPAWDVAQSLYPQVQELQSPDMGGWEWVDGLERAIANVVALVGTVSTVKVAGLDPTVRAIKQGINAQTPNEIPGPGDLVRFLVREALDPSFREEQMAGFNSPLFFDLMAKHGFNREQAEAFWRAHWELPSPTQTAELVHRLRPGRVAPALAFTLDDARTLFKQADILPKYIDQLLAITYAPMTRVDIRRVYQTGGMTYAEMVERYKDIGYDEATAKMLSDFTVKDLEPDERALTLGQATAAYREELLSAEELTGVATELGLSERAIDLYVRTQVAIKARQEQAAIQAEQKRLTRLALRTRRASRAGRLNESDLRLELEELGLDAMEVERFMAFNVMPANEKARDLTTSQVLQAFKKNVKTEAETRTDLGLLGYDSTEVRVLVDTARASMSKGPNAKKDRELTLSQIRKAVKDNTITLPSAEERLRNRGYDDEEVRILLAEFYQS